MRIKSRKAQINDINKILKNQELFPGLAQFAKKRLAELKEVGGVKEDERVICEHQYEEVNFSKLRLTNIVTHGVLDSRRLLKNNGEPINPNGFYFLDTEIREKLLGMGANPYYLLGTWDGWRLVQRRRNDVYLVLRSRTEGSGLLEVLSLVNDRIDRHCAGALQDKEKIVDGVKKYLEALDSVKWKKVNRYRDEAQQFRKAHIRTTEVQLHLRDSPTRI